MSTPERRFEGSDSMKGLRALWARRESMRHSTPQDEGVVTRRIASWRESCPFAGGGPNTWATDPIANDLIELEGGDLPDSEY